MSDSGAAENMSYVQHVQLKELGLLERPPIVHPLKDFPALHGT
jgi:hypothetical protein